MTDWRPITRELLQLLSSAEEQRHYEREVPHVDITRELVALWFDTTYHPDDAQFQECFTEVELGKLADFNSLYAHLKQSLPPSEGTVETWLNWPAWNNLREEAGRLAKKLK